MKIEIKNDTTSVDAFIRQQMIIINNETTSRFRLFENYREDLDLIRRAKTGDGYALTEIFRNYHHPGIEPILFCMQVELFFCKISMYA